MALHTPKCQSADCKKDPAFHNELQIALALAERALAAGIAFKAIVIDNFYDGYRGLIAALRQRRLPFVRSNSGTVAHNWAPLGVSHSFNEAGDLQLRPAQGNTSLPER